MVMLETVKKYLRSGWVEADETWAYASATTITVPSGAASKYQKGDKIKITNNSATKYFYIVGVADTVLTVTGGSDYTVHDSAITLPYYSHFDNPLGFPLEGFSYVPTISTTANAGTFSVVKFRLTGNRCTYRGKITYANALASGNLTITLPIVMSSLKATLPIGMAHYFNTGVADVRCFVNTVSTSTISFHYMDGNSSFTGTFINSAEWSSGDYVDWECNYSWS